MSREGAYRRVGPAALLGECMHSPVRQGKADETSRRYLFVAIDRATRWVFIRIYNSKTAANARRFLRDLERTCPMRIRTILTDNGKEFTDRLFGL